MPKPPKAKRKVESRKLVDLLEFPTQAELFPTNAHDDAALADDIKMNGLKARIHILPENEAGYSPNTILYGHRRVRALLKIGKTERKVVVRYDLAEANAAEIEHLFIADNEQRRQLSKLGQARLALRHLEIEKGRDPNSLCAGEDTEVRERIGKILGMSGRNVDRLLNILRTPLAVQQAFEREKVTLVLAEKVSRLNKGQQEAISEAIIDGKDPKKAIEKYIQKQKPKAEKDQGSATKSFVHLLEKACQGIGDSDLADVKFDLKPIELDVLRKARRYCGQLLTAAEGHEDEIKAKSKRRRRRPPVLIPLNSPPDMMSGI